MDNSPRWDAPYSRVVVGTMPPYTRLDRQFVGAEDQRPTDEEYDRYVWLVEEMRRAGYYGARLARTASFAVEDVFFSAVLAIACEVLADLGDRHRRPADEVAEIYALAGTVLSPGGRDGGPRDRDGQGPGQTGRHLAGLRLTVAGFAPLLLCGADHPSVEERLLALLASEDWCGHRDFVAALPPSTSPASAAFDPAAYWRGPQWPVLAWLLSWARADTATSRRPGAYATKGFGCSRTASSGSTTSPSPGSRSAAVTSRGRRRWPWTGWPPRDRTPRHPRQRAEVPLNTPAGIGILGAGDRSVRPPARLRAVRPRSRACGSRSRGTTATVRDRFPFVERVYDMPKTCSPTRRSTSSTWPPGPRAG